MLQRFKLLPLGFYRLLIVSAALVHLVFALKVLNYMQETGDQSTSWLINLVVILLVPLVPVCVYLLIIRIILWVADGFKKPV